MKIDIANKLYNKLQIMANRECKSIPEIMLRAIWTYDYLMRKNLEEENEITIQFSKNGKLIHILKLE